MKNTPSIPFVSIIVPVYNGENTVLQCAESIFSLNYPKDLLEIIFVDNNSKDHTFELLESFAESGKILLLKETKVLNAYGARNTGIRAAKGEILAFTDADCEAEVEWLSELISRFDDLAIGCVAGEIIPGLPKNILEKYSGINFYKQHSGRNKKVLGGNCAYRREIFDLIGDFRTDVPSGGDTELPLRMQEKTPYLICINTSAIVYHQNVGTIAGFIKQFMRYGTQRWILEKASSNGGGKQHIFKLLISSLVNIGSFVKRAIFVLLLIDHGREEDVDIYIIRPLLHIVKDWSAFIGYHFAVRNQDLLR